MKVLAGEMVMKRAGIKQGEFWASQRLKEVVLGPRKD
jgi:hypothetical protein